MGSLTWVRWGAGYRVAGVLGVIVVIKILSDGVMEGQVIVAVASAALFGLLVVPVFANSFFWGVGYGANGLTCRSAWRKTRNLAWADVAAVSFSVGLRQWVIVTHEHGSIRVNVLANGSERLIEELRRHGLEVEDHGR